MATTLYCSFCGKTQHEVRQIIAGPTVLICGECVGVCVDVLVEIAAKETAKASELRAALDHIQPQPPLPAICGEG